jgi:hypothetical protein
MGQLDELRKSLGMPPANDDDLGEIVAFLIMFELAAKTVTDECEAYPADERDAFMMTYAAYLKWLMSLSVLKRFSEETWQSVTTVIEREFSKQSWYRSETVDAIYNMMLELPPLESKGRYFGICLPWGGAVMTAFTAGVKLSESKNMKFHLYVIEITKRLFKTMSVAKPAE